MKRKIIFVTAVLLSAALALSACGFSGSPETGTTASPAATPADAKNPDFPDLVSFTAQTLDGGTFGSADLAGKDLTIVNFWATYCGPCLAEMEDLAAFAKSLPDNVNFITYCEDAVGNNDLVSEILSDAGFEGTTLIYGEGDLTKVLNEIIYIPTTLFFDSNGVCVGTEIIGGQEDFAASYKSAVNSCLTALGLDAI